MRVLGIDPGFASLGWAEAESNLGGLAFTRVGNVHTKKEHDRSAAEDLFARCRLISSGLLGCNVPGLVCLEAMSHPRNASSATKLGASHGVIAALVESCFECEVVMLSPLAARKVVTGLKKPSEEVAHQRLLAQFPELVRLTEGLRKKDTPHIMDAALQVAAWDRITR